MKKNILFAFVILTGLCKIASAQNTPVVNTVQPVIMVIPYAKDGEDMRTLLENDFNKRLAIAKVKNAFDSRGFTTRDFVATLKQAIDNKLFTSNAQSDVKSQLVELSGADIYVEVDIHMVPTEKGKQAMVLLSAYDAATASAYATVTCDSRERYGSDDATLINVAISIPSPKPGVALSSPIACSDEFLNILQAKFTDIVNNGRPIKVDFSLAPEAAHTFDSAIQGVQLSDAIEDFMAANAFKNDVHSQGSTSTRLFFDVVKIPVRDINSRNYPLSAFARKITGFLQTKGITAKRSIKNGGIFISIVN